MKDLRPDRRHHFIPRAHIPEGGLLPTQDEIAFIDLPGSVQVRFDDDNFVIIVVPLSVSLHTLGSLTCDELVTYLTDKSEATMASAAPVLKRLLRKALRSAQAAA